jgi:RNA 2',3'-cyclic 3'-phosphodiesterase
MEVEFYRLFVSLPVPPKVRQTISEFTRELGTQMPSDAVRWTPMEQIHLTLKFLGKVESSAVPDLEEALTAATQGTGTFELQIAELGAFPSLRNPRVIWIGLAGGLEALLRLQTQVADAVAHWCEKEENRKFTPHLTLGRVREPQSGVQRKISVALQGASAPEVKPWRGDRLLLMRSQLSPHGASHSSLAEFPL